MSETTQPQDGLHGQELHCVIIWFDCCVIEVTYSAHACSGVIPKAVIQVFKLLYEARIAFGQNYS